MAGRSVAGATDPAGAEVRDHYEVLGVSRRAPADDVLRAYRTLARRYHPDVYRGPDAGRRFAEVDEAYRVLRDPPARAGHDRSRRPARKAVTAVPPVDPYRMGLDIFAERAGLHPELVARFVALGLVDAERDALGRLWFGPAALPTVARVQRLRADLGLNYAAVGLVLDLLDRIDVLESAADAT
jgi:chaperone modulatory protein CbpM